MNIRLHAIRSPDSPDFKKFMKLGDEAEKLYNRSVPILNSMREKTSVSEILEKEKKLAGD